MRPHNIMLVLSCTDVRFVARCCLGIVADDLCLFARFHGWTERRRMLPMKLPTAVVDDQQSPNPERLSVCSSSDPSNSSWTRSTKLTRTTFGASSRMTQRPSLCTTVTAAPSSSEHVVCSRLFVSLRQATRLVERTRTLWLGMACWHRAVGRWTRHP